MTRGLNCRRRGFTSRSRAPDGTPSLRGSTTMQDITHQNLEADLVNASLAQPVLLDIWAPWCGPCKTLGPMLEKLETAYAGRFKLVKLNADDEPEIAQQLSQMFGVRSIPFCVLFKGGQPVDGFVGALPEAEVRKFLDKHVPSAEEQARRGRRPGRRGAARRRRHRRRARPPAGGARDQPGQRHRALRLPARAAQRRPRRRGARRVRSGRRQPGARPAPGRRGPLDRGARSGAEGAPARHARGGDRRQQARLRRPLRARAAPLRQGRADRRRWTSCSRSSCATRPGRTSWRARTTSRSCSS